VKALRLPTPFAPSVAEGVHATSPPHRDYVPPLPPYSCVCVRGYSHRRIQRSFVRSAKKWRKKRPNFLHFPLQATMANTKDQHVGVEALNEKAATSIQRQFRVALARRVVRDRVLNLAWDQIEYHDGIFSYFEALFLC
jgi:hypothetical protein